jgi:hypothetical protein
MLRRLTCLGLLLIAGLSGCAGLNVTQERGWTAFHDCQRTAASSAALEDLQESGRVNYRTQDGVEFSSMKTCMESRGYACDLGVAIGFRPYTYCYPKTS